MTPFTTLYQHLDRATGTTAKVEALAAYFRSAPPVDAIHAVALLSGQRPKRVLNSPELRTLAGRLSGLPEWLVEETYAHVGDLAETVALLCPAGELDSAAAVWGEGTGPRACTGLDRGAQGPVERKLPFSALDTILHRPLSEWLTSSLPALLGEPPELRIAQLEDWLRRLPLGQRFVLLKLITGAFRVGVSQKLMAQGLGRAFELAPSLLADRLVGGVGLSAMDFEALVDPVSGDTDSHRPYPFFLASPLAAEPDTLGSPAEWLAEWKWDGIRAQLIRRDQAILWSRGEERLDGRFPEIEAAAVALPAGCVLDGEILAWRDDAPLPFQQLQRRIGRRKPGARLLAEVPLRFLAYDLLEFNGTDLRPEALRQRRQRLQLLIPPAANGALGLSPGLPFEQWHTLAQLRGSARERGVEGVMIKRLDSPYRRGRKRGDWWKWKLEPLSIDAVLIYAQAGHGRRANLYTDYSFALWDGDRLVPVAKAYSGLDDAEIQRLDRWIRSHTVERFGPVRSVTPELVFELGFEAVQASTRHKSGVAVRFPRILRWREDKRPEQADTLTALKSLAGLQPSTA